MKVFLQISVPIFFLIFHFTYLQFFFLFQKYNEIIFKFQNFPFFFFKIPDFLGGGGSCRARHRGQVPAAPGVGGTSLAAAGGGGRTTVQGPFLLIMRIEGYF